MNIEGPSQGLILVCATHREQVYLIVARPSLYLIKMTLVSSFWTAVMGCVVEYPRHSHDILSS